MYRTPILYASAALWNICMGMLQVLLPLYALSLGFSVLKISSVIAFPVLAETLVRFIGSALSDRFGEGRVLKFCYFLMALSGIWLLGADDYRDLLIAQGLASLSRGGFWTSVQSLISQLPGPSMGKKLGWLSAGNYAGSMIGLGMGGVLAALLGYRGAFGVFLAAALLCSLLGVALPRPEPKPRGRTLWQIAFGIGRFLRYPHTWLLISVSYAAALPVALTVSIYPIYLGQLNYGEQWIGAAVSIRAFGPILIGLSIGSLITPERERGIYALGMATLGLFIMASGLSENLLVLGFFIAALGAAGGVMDILYQVQAAASSKAGDRSVAMASMGLGWNLAPFFTPLIVGWLAETGGFRLAFFLTGAFFLLIGAATKLWHQLLAPNGLPSWQADIVESKDRSY